MRKVALTIAASLVLAVVAPAFSQPFADVPTDHWAFDAIAELAAKGIVEGYPDGTFKGDRAMTRYEMAMVVARLLARIEAIKVPAPAAPPKVPAPEVTRADVTTLQRLINEFRAELAALGVRVTAVEEELAALRDRLDNVRVTGDARLRYNIFPSGSPSGTFPNVNWRNRLQFTGRVSPTIAAVTRVTTGSVLGTSDQFPLGLIGANAVWNQLSFDLAYLDLGAFGVNWRIGRQTYALSPVGNSGTGLLFDPDTIGGTGMSDGARGSFNFSGFGLEFGVWRGGDVVNASDVSMDIWSGRLSASLIPGWTFNLSGISQRRNAAAAVNPNTSDTGLSVDATGNLLPGIGLGAAFATFNPTGSPSSSAWLAWLSFDLGGITGMTTFAPKLALWYKSYGKSGDCNPAVLGVQACVGPYWSAASTEFFNNNIWDFRGWGTQLTLTFSPVLSAFVIYEAGNINSSGTSYNEWFANVDYSLATRTTLSVNYRRWTAGGVDGANQYRVQLSYSF